jgi:hypothetical protein
MTVTSPTPSRAIRRRATAFAIATGVADVHRDPDPRSELVTQALLGAPAIALAADPGGWTCVRLTDYEGWVESVRLAPPPEPSAEVVVVSVPRAPLYRHGAGAEARGEVYATTVLPILHPAPISAAGRIPVGLPGGEDGWLAPADVIMRPADSPFPLLGVEAALALAHRLLGTPYLWGGVIVKGIDCSGLSQLACREGGAVIPRNADQQYAALPYIVERASVRAGDLVYFASDGSITHVGIALDNMTVLHANGYDARVSITSLVPSHGDYSVMLADSYAGARRPFPDMLTIVPEQS